uniref:Ig-like domain-containing protein n=1 Tax=Pygocentrus nattereri TaxID=42514 RepID=A0AAR2JR40_PYGNA
IKLRCLIGFDLTKISTLIFVFTASHSLLFIQFNQVFIFTASHSLQYFYTAVTPGIHFPEFTVVGLLDGEQFVYYDSDIRKKIPKTEWMKKRDTEKQQGTQESFKANVATAMKRFNQTYGVHIVQFIVGCELDDDGTRRRYMQHGYDGEDYISLDLKTLTWTAANAKAVTTKQKWDGLGEAARQRAYLENECIDWLQKYVEYGRSTLERKVPPEVSLFQKDSSSPVVCHATGFFPKAVMIAWQKNGEDLHEDVELRETLPNQDGTFQKRSVLAVSPEELKKNKYTCVVQHSGLEREMVLQVSDYRVLSGGGSVGLIGGAVFAGLLLVVIACVGVLSWRRKSEQSSYTDFPITQH